MTFMRRRLLLLLATALKLLKNNKNIATTSSIRPAAKKVLYQSNLMPFRQPHRQPHKTCVAVSSHTSRLPVWYVCHLHYGASGTGTIWGNERRCTFVWHFCVCLLMWRLTKILNAIKNIKTQWMCSVAVFTCWNPDWPPTACFSVGYLSLVAAQPMVPCRRGFSFDYGECSGTWNYLFSVREGKCTIPQMIL